MIPRGYVRCAEPSCPLLAVTSNYRPRMLRCSWHDGSVLYCECPEPDFDGIECRRCFRAPHWAHQGYRDRV